MHRQHLNSTECPDTFADRIEGSRGLIATVAAGSLFLALSASYLLGNRAEQNLVPSGVIARAEPARTQVIESGTAASAEACDRGSALRVRQAGDSSSLRAEVAVMRPILVGK